ncbi:MULTISPECIES: polymorphic outer membrane protein middle domain-containing protein [Chlamydia]|uniref:Autotransporter domain-containing protein n=1 Tax=Chlamydia crocodili TaxID=2766982 RepID=A0ABX8CI18_9CHLA|nr:polymorphic outer membrane protein middle domain-containing protein [Chlamydia crocodili]QVE48822.1 autotransporter domain-containing protein [Chlamydia crocodili]
MKHKFINNLILSTSWLAYFYSIDAREIVLPYPTTSVESLYIPKSIELLLQKTNLTGKTHSSDSLTLQNYPEIFSISQITNDSAGASLRCNKLYIQDTQGPIILIGNITPRSGGGIYTDNNLEITNSDKSIIFSNNLARSTAVEVRSNHGGAIHTRYLDIKNNKEPIYFLRNSTSASGGAIMAAKIFNLSDNKSSCIFYDNQSLSDTGLGGALRLEHFNCTNNYGDTLFVNNQSGTGGAISAIYDCLFSGNQGNIIFKNNVAFSTGNNDISGGAIAARNVTLENNTGITSFHNNSSAVHGGACRCVKFIVRNSNDVYFTNNSSQLGGAIIVMDSGCGIELSADKGNIVFNNNLSITPTDIIRRNSIYIGSSNSSIVRFGAKLGHHILFYDPIEHELPTSNNMIINPNIEDQGCVIFSGATVSDAIKTENNLFSKCKNTIELKNGVLAIENDAALATFKFIQTGGIICLGTGGTLTTREKDTNNKAADLQLSNLGLILPQLLTSKAKAAKLWIYPTKTTQNSTDSFQENTAAAIYVSGDLLLTNEEGHSPYDDTDLSRGITRIPLLYLCDNATKKINIDSLNIHAINQKAHYGYQGIWSTYWEEYTTTANSTSALTANTSHRILYADWTPTGYVPNPKYTSALVANALWGSVYTTLSGMRTLPSPVNARSHFEFGGQGLGMTIHQRNRLGVRGFHMESAGYAATSSAVTKINHKISFSFSQQISHIKERASSNKISSKNYFGGMQLRLPWLNDSFVTTGSLAYNYGDHTAKHFYTEENKASEGYFYSHTLGACLSCILQLSPTNRALSVAPFIEALAFRATLSSFIEQGDFPRKFTVNQPLLNVTLPVGVFMQWVRNVHLPTLWQIQIAYHPVIYRDYPQILATLTASNGTWPILGTPITRHALAYKIGNETKIFSHLKVFLNYQGNISSSTFCNYLKAGSTLAF